jgi:ribosomal protein L11 methyltransferase
MLWKISVLTTAEAEEAVAELLEEVLAQPPASYTDAEGGATMVSVYLRKRPEWPRARRAALAARLQQIRQSGLNIGPGRVSLRQMRHQDWAESWKRHFRPLAIGASLLVKPSWSRRRARKGQTVVVLDPGLSFGTGQHPTTAFCLRQLVARRRPGEAQACLDVGTGSGILAIAAARLGYCPVDAFDCDPQSVRIAQANARRNRVAGQIRFRQQDLTQLPLWAEKQYSLVCANLVANLLLTQRKRLLARVRKGGVLVVAGILRGEFTQVQKALAAAGLQMTASQTEGEWRSGAFGWR